MSSQFTCLKNGQHLFRYKSNKGAICRNCGIISTANSVSGPLAGSRSPLNLIEAPGLQKFEIRRKNSFQCFRLRESNRG